MAKNQKIFICSNCNFQVTQWMGRCGECGEWNSLQESLKKTSININNLEHESTPLRIREISVKKFQRIESGIFEFDRVLGGGLVPGSLILIGGEPGVGKSTLLTKVLSQLAKRLPKESFLYVSGEESQAQVASRARRLGIESDSFYIYNQTCWQNILKEIKKIKPMFMVLDSIQTTVSREIQSQPGTISQVREVTYELMNHVKATGITCFVVGHITKEGTIAGPKILEHMVDTVVYFEGDQYGHYRILRAIKNRFGSTREVGIFEMSEDGLIEVKNPSQYFLEDSVLNSYGKSITCVREGSRTLFAEIQALVIENKCGNGRRTTQGIDANRVSMMIAIIEKYIDIPMGFNDIYINVVSNMKIGDRESDLSIIASLLSSYKARAISKDVVFLGEVGLTGEIRSVPNMGTIIGEMEQLSYKKLIASSQIATKYNEQSSLEIIGIQRIDELLNHI